MALCGVIVYKDSILNLLTFFEHRKESKEAGQDEESVKLNIKRKMGFKVKSKHPFQEDDSIPDFLHSEKYPADGYNQKVYDCAWPFSYLLIKIEKEHPFEHQEHSMISTPQHKTPRGTMP